MVWHCNLVMVQVEPVPAARQSSMSLLLRVSSRLTYKVAMVDIRARAINRMVRELVVREGSLR
jgi:hypothetical protein